MSFDSINLVLKDSLAKTAIGKQVKLAMALEKSNQVLADMFGDLACKKARAVYIKDKIVTYACLSSCLASQINLRRQEVIKKINLYLQEEYIVNIKFIT